ncbi:MAG: LemA family protein [Prevotellaceae bacterium]|jgi:LemA protein|nr:LemA family protein [Prevotellaceae bacterium]
MNTTTIIVLSAVALLVIILIALYNRLNIRRNQIENAKSSLEALFIKRSDLIPNLVTVVKEYTSYERDVLDKITRLRADSQKDKPSMEYQHDGDLSSAVKRLMVQVENYPELKANSQFTNLAYSWNEVEEQITAGRRYLASSITYYNDAIRIFPSNMVAGMFGFKAHEWERATQEQRKGLNADELFK